MRFADDSNLTLSNQGRIIPWRTHPDDIDQRTRMRRLPMPWDVGRYEKKNAGGIIVDEHRGVLSVIVSIIVSHDGLDVDGIGKLRFFSRKIVYRSH